MEAKDILKGLNKIFRRVRSSLRRHIGSEDLEKQDFADKGTFLLTYLDTIHVIGLDCVA